MLAVLASLVSTVCAPAPDDGSVLPFPSVPMESVTKARLEDSQMKWPTDPQRLRRDAPRLCTADYQPDAVLFFRQNRFLCLLMVVLTTGCTSVKTMPFSELEGRKPLKGTYIITTRDDKVVKTDRVAIEDSALVVSALIVEGGRRDVEPYSIPYQNVVSVSQERTNWIVLTAVVAGLTACVIAIGALLADFGSFGN